MNIKDSVPLHPDVVDGFGLFLPEGLYLRPAGRAASLDPVFLVDPIPLLEILH